MGSDTTKGDVTGGNDEAQDSTEGHPLRLGPRPAGRTCYLWVDTLRGDDNGLERRGAVPRTTDSGLEPGRRKERSPARQAQHHSHSEPGVVTSLKGDWKGGQRSMLFQIGAHHSSGTSP